MAFGLFKKQVPEPAAPAAEARVPQALAPAEAASAEGDSAKAILELLELELGAMIRQLERAANSVAGGAEATAATLSTIRRRTDALTNRTSAAQGTATTFSHAADKFTQSAQGIGRSHGRPRCWRSIPPSRPPAPARPDAALRSSPPR
jgi:methyl-accepting chemotaxis protein